jgi:hypothetical protein
MLILANNKFLDNTTNMTHPNVPEIRSLPDSTLSGVGEEVQFFIHDDSDPSFPVLTSGNAMINEVVSEMFRQEGVHSDRNLEELCILAARITVGKLATSPGFRFEFGSYFESPSEVIDVKLRRKLSTVVEADVSSS